MQLTEEEALEWAAYEFMKRTGMPFQEALATVRKTYDSGGTIGIGVLGSFKKPIEDTA